MKVYDFAEAIAAHRQTHHPTVYNVPDANLNVKIELNMTGEKVVSMPYLFIRVTQFGFY